MTNLLLSLMALVARQAKAGFVAQTRRVEAAQTQFLRSLLRLHQDTELGKKFGLADIHTIDQFRERVPILPYSSYEPYIERTAAGEKNLLTPEPIVFFNMTSGSTGKRKLIPVTKRSRRAVSLANQVAIGFAAEAAQRENRPFGKILYTTPVRSLGYTDSGIPYGPISTSDLRLMGPLYRLVFAYPFEALQIPDSLARHYVCLLFALRNDDLRVIGATFPVLALRLADYLENHGEDLVRDLETGELADWLDIPDDLRRALAKHFTAAPRRAAKLRQILNQDGRLTPYRVFPNLSFIITARGGTSNFYFERFPEYFGDTPVFGGIYSSAETVFGVHRDFGTDGVILAIESGFYEFIPEDQWDAPQPQTVLPWEVQPGRRYRILVTNYSGFYRYDIGDVVEVEGFFNQAPIFVFRHRRGGMLSSTTEKTTEFHVTQAMRSLQQEFHIALENFCITLADDVIPAPYLVNIELAPGYSLADPERFRQRFDETLKEVHASYEVKRRDQVPPPRLRILAPGSFAEVRRRMVQRGVAEFQIKFPLVSEDRSLLAGLTVAQEVRPDEAGRAVGAGRDQS
jgi:hypothetical protein